MRRVAFLCIILVFLLCSIAKASISNDVDSFTGEKIYRSVYKFEETGTKSSLAFKKIFNGNAVSYEVSTFEDNFTYVHFSKEPAEIKIDDKPVQTLQIKKTYSFPSSMSKISLIGAVAIVPEGMEEDIKTANRVAIRFYLDSGVTSTMIVPDNILKEWQEVINTKNEN